MYMYVSAYGVECLVLRCVLILNFESIVQQVLVDWLQIQCTTYDKKCKCIHCMSVLGLKLVNFYVVTTYHTKVLLLLESFTTTVIAIKLKLSIK